MEGRPRILAGVLVRFRKTENHLQRVLERVRKEKCLKSLKVMEESLRTLGTVFAVFMHVIACFMFCCGIQMVFRDVAVDRKQLCCGRLVTVVDWLDECEGDGLLDCGCIRKYWTDPWMGFRSKTHWTDCMACGCWWIAPLMRHGMRLQ